MKKRLKNKLLKNANTNQQNKLLKEISKHFTIKEKQFGNGYFIFSMGINAVCHFELVDTPGWRYGIWLDGKKYRVFGEHNDLIDKFKPSATYVSFDDDLSSFIDVVKKIKENPKLYFVDSLTRGEALVAFEQYKHGKDVYYEGYQVKRLYNESTELWDIIVRDETITQEAFVEKEYSEFQAEKEKKAKEFEEDKQYAMNFFKELPNLDKDILAVGVFDSNKKGFICNPRFDLRIILSPGFSEKEFEEKFYEIDKLIHEKNYANERKGWENRFELSDGYDDVEDIKECDYQFFKTA